MNNPIRRRLRHAHSFVLALVAGAVLPAGAEVFPCLLEPSADVDASTAVEGILATVDVDKGDMVTADQVVAALDASVEKALLDQAQARVEMTASLRAREAELELATLRYERAQELSSNSFISPDELDELRTSRQVAELRLIEQQESRRLARLELERVRAQYELRFIRSPITGVVVDRYLSAGEFAQAQPIVRLAQLDPVNVEVVMPSRRFNRVRTGMRARVRTPGPDGIEFGATVTLVERVVDAASDTFGVRLQVANPDHVIPVGMECVAEIEIDASTAGQ